MTNFEKGNYVVPVNSNDDYFDYYIVDEVDKNNTMISCRGIRNDYSINKKKQIFNVDEVKHYTNEDKIIFFKNKLKQIQNQLRRMEIEFEDILK